MRQKKIIFHHQCAQFLTTKDNKTANTYSNMWPSFYWYILSDNDIIQNYGCFLWKFIPIAWQRWWAPLINYIPSYN